MKKQGKGKQLSSVVTNKQLCNNIGIKISNFLKFGKMNHCLVYQSQRLRKEFSEAWFMKQICQIQFDLLTELPQNPLVFD